MSDESRKWTRKAHGGKVRLALSLEFRLSRMSGLRFQELQAQFDKKMAFAGKKKKPAAPTASPKSTRDKSGTTSQSMASSGTSGHTVVRVTTTIRF